MSHQKVAVLNGGLAAYANRFPDDLEAAYRAGTLASYKANLNNSIIADSSAVQSALQDGTQLLDARSLGEHVGVVTARPAERPGAIPGARHLPFDWFVDVRGNILDNKAATTLFKAAGVSPDRDGTVHFCHSGNRAALTWFVDYAILGNGNARLYDGSMGEWAIQESLPMENKIDLKVTEE